MRFRGRFLPAVGIMGTIAWFSHQPAWPTALVGIPDELLHGSAYAALAVAFFYAWRGDGVTKVSVAATWAIALSSAYGALDEVHQSFVPGRDASFGDWLADTAGAVLGVGVLVALSFAGLWGLWENRRQGP